MKKGFVAWVHMDSFFKSYLGEIIVGDPLKHHAKVTEDIVVVWIYL